jgi:glutathione synthase/RimK-type ligase-like ATP-grasp enzyme
MKTVAFLVTHDYYPSRLDRSQPDYAADQLKLLGTALAPLDIELVPVFWQDDGNDWSKYQAVLPLMAWNYPKQVELFLRRITEIETAGIPVLNDAKTLRANMDKAYLAKLAQLGAPVPPTISLETCDEGSILASFEELGANEIIVKPRIGAGAWRQIRLKRGESVPPVDLLPPSAALVQPFLTSVTWQGEMSLLYFGGVLSHSLMKQPKAGDYRTQGQFGAVESAITAPADAIAAASRVLALATPTPLLYARVDLVQGQDGQWLLMELELIEPWLYLDHDGHKGRHGAALFAQSLHGLLSAHLG